MTLNKIIMILQSGLLYTTSLWAIAFILLVGIFLFYLLGSRVGNYIKLKFPATKAVGIGPLEGALLGLLSLLLGFTFSQSASRYDSRRALIVQEANDIGTVILHCDMYPDSIKTQFRKSLKQYVEIRIAYYEATDETEIQQLLAKGEKTISPVWKSIVDLSKKSPDFVRDNQMIVAINAMMDVVTSRDASRLARVPDLIVWLLITLTLLGSFIVGYGKKEKKNDWIILTLYSLMTIMTIYTILDFDRPRTGIIQTSTPHEKMYELRNYFSNSKR